MEPDLSREQTWPELPLEAWADTCATLHLWTQIAGKIRMTLSPPINHSWHVALYVTSSGLTTSPIPHGGRTFQIDFDFIRGRLHIPVSDGSAGGFPLEPQTVAEFYRRLMSELRRLNLPVRIHNKPNELADATPFDQDELHRSYEAEYANRYWRILVQTDRVMKEFRGQFIGKCSPAHLFWGALDLAVTRFSGRRAPRHPGGIPNLPDEVTREAYSHEVSSCGFWPGGAPLAYPAFYSYAYPEPPGFADARVKPSTAFYSAEFHEFILPYSAVRESESPDRTLLEFFHSTYETAANLAKWNRQELERT